MNRKNILNILFSKKKFFIPFLLVIFALIVYGFVFAYQLKQERERNAQEKKSDFVQVSFLDDKKTAFKDSDGDGVYDYIEKLYPELDPYNPDSDGDGVSDAKYLERKQQIRRKTRKDEEEEQISPSQKLGRGVLMALMAIREQGGELDEKTQEQISQNIQKYISNLSLGEKLFIRDDLDIVEDSKKNSFAYRDAMKKFLKKNQIRTSEIDLILKATKDPQQYKPELEKAALKYQLYREELAKFKVPSLVAGRHTQLLNAAGQLEGALKNLVKDEPDDIVSLSSFVQMSKIMNDIVDAISHIEVYFELIEEPDAFNI